MARSGFDTSRA